MSNRTKRFSRKVAIVDLGENLSIDSSKLSKKLNKLQHTWRFQAVGARPSLGDPDVESIWFYVDRLFDELKSHEPTANFDLVIGLTHVRLENRDSSLGVPDRDYFGLNDQKRIAVVTEAMQQWNSPHKDVYQYLMFLIAGEVLQIAAQTNLFHQSKEICLFDDCADRAELRAGIERGRICPLCRNALFRAQVPEIMIEDCMRILKWCRRNTVRKSVAMTFGSPLVSLVVGTFIGWITSSFIGGIWWKPMLVGTLLLSVGVFLINRYAPHRMPHV